MRIRTIAIAATIAGAQCFGTLPAPASAAGMAAPDVPLDTPTPLISGTVSSYVLSAPKIFWHNAISPCPPTLAAAESVKAPAAEAAAAQENLVETLQRIATTGSNVRTLFSKAALCGGSKIRSGIASDGQYLYWLSNDGVFRLSVDANVGDEPTLLNGVIGSFYGEVAVGDGILYVLRYIGPGYSLYSLPKAGGSATPMGGTPASSSSLQNDGAYTYLIGSGTLWRFDASGTLVRVVGNGFGGESRAISAIYAEGPKSTLCGIGPIGFCTTRRVYYAAGNQVNYYDAESGVLHSGAIYTSVDANARIVGLNTTPSTIFAFPGGSQTTNKLLISEDRPTGSFSATSVLLRTGRGGGTADPLYTSPSTFGNAVVNVRNDGTFIFWQEGNTLQRLPIDAAALPVVNVRVTGMEITQGIQNLSNSVRLIKKRRTFVRVYVQADGAPVNAVKAVLRSSTIGPFAELLPVNSVGTQLTVRTAPNRNDLNQSFLFELPWNWTDRPALNLEAVLNPYKVPLESNYADNTTSRSTTFVNSPTLSAQFFRINYRSGSTWFRPRIHKDVLQTYSWIIRAYPIGGAVGEKFKPTLWDVNDDGRVTSWVNQTSSDCNIYSAANRNLCASYYVNGWLKYYRDHAWVPDTNDFYYGMIDDGLAFPRGQAVYDKTSVGPSGPGTWGWDTDGSYADWYAAHEIGHSLGRGHPTPSAASCGNSASDNSFPYPGARIGPLDGSMNGFDVGDPSFGIPRAVYPGASWFDVMSYCSNQWISDYTYNGMYDYMLSHPSAALIAGPVSAASADVPAPLRIMLAGDFLSTAGSIVTSTNTASFSYIGRLNSVSAATPPDSGPYAIRMLDATSSTLATYGFTPEASHDGAGLMFDTTFTFAPGTRLVQVIRASDNAVMGSRAVSANAPTISGVALQGAPDPVSGDVTVVWTAADADGDSLTFDIFYSRDNGANWQPAKMGVTGNSTVLDTSRLGGGGTALLRVAVSDGVNTAEASSAPFVMANKAPEAFVLLPSSGTHVHYGQLVNFSGLALDVQDGLVAQNGLSWVTDRGVNLGSGGLASTDVLSVGVNIIYFTATNSLGLSSVTSVTVIVDDDLSTPGPVLSAGPTQVGWQVAAGSGTPQQAEVSLTNAGSGSASFSITSNTPWLTVSPITGTIGATTEAVTLTLTGAPSGLASDQTHHAMLTIVRPPSASGDVTQTLNIPVTLGIGFTRQPPTYKRYLPVAQRS